MKTPVLPLIYILFVFFWTLGVRASDKMDECRNLFNAKDFNANAAAEVASARDGFIAANRTLLAVAGSLHPEINRRSGDLAKHADKQASVHEAQLRWQNLAGQYGADVLPFALQTLQTSLSAFERGMATRLIASAGIANDVLIQALLELLDKHWEPALQEAAYKIKDPPNTFTHVEDRYAGQRTHWKERLSEHQLTALDIASVLDDIAGEREEIISKFIVKIRQVSKKGAADEGFQQWAIAVLSGRIFLSKLDIAADFARETVEQVAALPRYQLLQGFVRGRNMQLNVILKQHVKSGYTGTALRPLVNEALSEFEQLFMDRIEDQLELLTSEDLAFVKMLVAFEARWQILEGKMPTAWRVIEDLLNASNRPLNVPEQQVAYINVVALMFFDLPAHVKEQMAPTFSRLLVRLINGYRASTFSDSDEFRKYRELETMAGMVQAMSYTKLKKNDEVMKAVEYLRTVETDVEVLRTFLNESLSRIEEGLKAQ